MAEKASEADRFEFVERDESGDVVARYIHANGRLNVILPPRMKSPLQSLLDVFLPAGYPHSVTNDYLEYQIYDSLQAFSSSIAGLLSSRAVLSSVGVGDSTASPTAALLLSILQDSAGRVATILFAHRFGSSLEPECKMYRLLADILNDIAFVLDCLSPAFPKPMRVVVLSFSSVLRALCGVAAGSAKASLSAHFAKWGNLGELNAKDSSQETVISLLGMLAGSLVVAWVTTPVATWTTLVLLLSIHLETNRRAVCAVNMRTLNRQRATIVYHSCRAGHVPSPEEVSKQERIFERDGVLRRANGSIAGRCTVSSSMKSLLNAMKESPPQNGGLRSDRNCFLKWMSIFEGRKYLIWPWHAHADRARFQIVLKEDAESRDVLVAWWQALALAEKGQQLSMLQKQDNDEYLANLFDILRETADDVERLLKKCGVTLKSKGWDLDANSLVTSSITRIQVA